MVDGLGVWPFTPAESCPEEPRHTAGLLSEAHAGPLLARVSKQLWLFWELVSRAMNHDNYPRLSRAPHVVKNCAHVKLDVSVWGEAPGLTEWDTA